MTQRTTSASALHLWPTERSFSVLCGNSPVDVPRLDTEVVRGHDSLYAEALAHTLQVQRNRPSVCAETLTIRAVVTKDDRCIQPRNENEGMNRTEGMLSSSGLKSVPHYINYNYIVARASVRANLIHKCIRPCNHG